ncbi:MAG: hypothetical protein JW395_4119 [Nitrospira sp.]|nr:hypothetical protein [Nitrospira sp.]
MSDRDIWASAKLMLDQQGEDAVIEAAMKVDESALKDDYEGGRTFRRIKQAIEWLQDIRGRDPFKVEH